MQEIKKISEASLNEYIIVVDGPDSKLNIELTPEQVEELRGEPGETMTEDVFKTMMASQLSNFFKIVGPDWDPNTAEKNVFYFVKDK